MWIIRSTGIRVINENGWLKKVVDCSQCTKWVHQTLWECILKILGWNRWNICFSFQINVVSTHMAQNFMLPFPACCAGNLRKIGPKYTTYIGCTWVFEGDTDLVISNSRWGSYVICGIIERVILFPPVFTYRKLEKWPRPILKHLNRILPNVSSAPTEEPFMKSCHICDGENKKWTGILFSNSQEYTISVCKWHTLQLKEQRYNSSL